MIFEAEQGGQPLLVEFLDSDADVVRQDEVEKNLLLPVEVRRNSGLFLRSPSSLTLPFVAESADPAHFM